MQSRKQALKEQNLITIDRKKMGTIPGFFVLDETTKQEYLVKLANQEVETDEIGLARDSTPSLIMEFFGARVERYLLNYLAKKLGNTVVEVPEVSIIQLDN